MLCLIYIPIDAKLRFESVFVDAFLMPASK